MRWAANFDCRNRKSIGTVLRVVTRLEEVRPVKTATRSVLPFAFTIARQL